MSVDSVESRRRRNGIGVDRKGDTRTISRTIIYVEWASVYSDTRKSLLCYEGCGLKRLRLFFF